MGKVKFMIVFCTSLLVVCFMTGIVNAQDATDDSWVNDTDGVTTDDNATIRPNNFEGSLQVGPAAVVRSTGNAYYASSWISNTVNNAEIGIILNGFYFRNGVTDLLTILPDSNTTNINSPNNINITSDGVICIGDCD